jgi:hypothetical protein
VLAAKLLPRHSLAAKSTCEAKIFAQTQPKVNYSDQLLNLTPKEEWTEVPKQEFKTSIVFHSPWHLNTSISHSSSFSEYVKQHDQSWF